MGDPRQTFVDALMNAMQTAEVHLASEYVDDLGATLDSVTATPTYAFMPAPGRLTVITDPSGVRDFYVNARSVFEPMASRLFTHLAGDFYEFQENVPTRKLVAENRLVTINTVNIFPAARDGIQGEFLWERYPGQEPAPSVPENLGPADNIPTLKLRNAKVHERFLDALRFGDVDRLTTLLADDCLWAIRSYLPDCDEMPLMTAVGRGQVIALLKRWLAFASIERLSVLTRLATDWYVFAEELYTVRFNRGPNAGSLKEFRMASVYPIGAGGIIQGALGYGTDLVEPSPRSQREVGAISWVQEGSFEDDLMEPPVQ